jgi:cytochrome P450
MIDPRDAPADLWAPLDDEHFYAGDPFPPTMTHTDPPVHTRYRKLVQPGFAPSIIRALEPTVRARVVALLDRLEPGAPVDFERSVLWSEAAIPGALDLPYDQILALTLSRESP